jgi:pyruvate dehydrogenase E2 component (dihydrolipoyllysine-residue acetyltransferase)
MATDVVMPRLSDSMEEGTILKWLVEPGGEVKRGEGLVEIETDKANMTYDADTDGVLVEVIASEGDTLAVGEVIARIGDSSEKPVSGVGSRGDDQQPDTGVGSREPEPDVGGGFPPSDDAPEAEPGLARREAAREPERSDGGNGGDPSRVKASPVARRMAREMGVELAGLSGSGPGGRIVKADVEAATKDGGARVEAAAAPPPPPDSVPAMREGATAKGETQVIELTRLQQTVTRRMAESKATAPDFTLIAEVDMTLAVELRKRLKDATEHPPSFNDMIVKAAANALREHPRVNGAYRDGRFELYSRVNVGIAVAAQDALVVPTIFDADRKSLGQIAREGRELAEKVRDGKITPPEVAGGTFTVSNLGMYGIDEFTAVINPPQAAILTVGALKKRAIVDDSGRVVPRDTLKLSLVCDHRILYGADGAVFLARVRELLEQPLALAL